MRNNMKNFYNFDDDDQNNNSTYSFNAVIQWLTNLIMPSNVDTSENNTSANVNVIENTEIINNQNHSLQDNSDNSVINSNEITNIIDEQSEQPSEQPDFEIINANEDVQEVSNVIINNDVQKIITAIQKGLLNGVDTIGFANEIRLGNEDGSITEVPYIESRNTDGLPEDQKATICEYTNLVIDAKFLDNQQFLAVFKQHIGEKEVGFSEADLAAIRLPQSHNYEGGPHPYTKASDLKAISTWFKATQEGINFFDLNAKTLCDNLKQAFGDDLLEVRNFDGDLIEVDHALNHEIGAIDSMYDVWQTIIGDSEAHFA